MSVSLVVPAFNEEEAITSFIDRIVAVRDKNLATFGDLEVIIVNDGSGDATAATAEKALTGRLGGRVISLAKNVGSHAAIRCGLESAAGDILIVMSGDGQDPPEMLPELVAAFDEGLEIVWGQRGQRANDKFLRKTLATAYYRIFRVVTGLNYPPAGLDVMAINRRVLEALLLYRERHASLFLVVFNLGFADGTVSYVRAERTAGVSGWTLSKRIKLAVDMLTSFSAAPIRLLSVMGILVGTLGLFVGGVTLIRGLLGLVPVSGWASLMVISSLMSGVMLVAIGFLGELVWRTLDEVRQRPLFIESERVEISSP